MNTKEELRESLTELLRVSREFPRTEHWVRYFAAQIAELDRQIAFDAARAAQATETKANVRHAPGDGGGKLPERK